MKRVIEEAATMSISQLQNVVDGFDQGTGRDERMRVANSAIRLTQALTRHENPAEALPDTVDSPSGRPVPADGES